MDKKILGKKIRYIRLMHLKERKEVADYLDLGLSQYSNLENGVSAIDDEKLQKLALYYHTTKEQIENIDPEKVVHQINNDNSLGIGINLGTIYQQNNELITKLLQNQDRLLEILNKQKSE